MPESTVISLAETDPAAVAPRTPSIRTSLSVNELADRWHCDPQLVYRRIRRNDIHAFKIGFLWRIPAEEVTRLEALGPVVNSDGQPVDDVEASISALVAASPPLTDQQRIRISALLLTGNGNGGGAA